MPFEKIQTERLSNAVVRQIEGLILEGILRPGERLPAERELADRMGVSRPSLREAIAELQDKGLLVSKASAGIFVADLIGTAFAPALAQLFSENDKAVFDVISFRRDVEGLAAERACRQGSDTDLAVVNAIYSKMERAHLKRNPTDEADLDAEFHLSIIEASHNVIMIHMMRSMYQLVRNGVFYNRQVMFRQKTTRDALLIQHGAINTALQSRDPGAARAAIVAHLDYVAGSLEDDRKTAENETIAKRRLEQEHQR
ncbi:MAG: FCD domain-containing protein [Pseudomonadota bacterium]